MCYCHISMKRGLKVRGTPAKSPFRGVTQWKEDWKFANVLDYSVKIRSLNEKRIERNMLRMRGVPVPPELNEKRIESILLFLGILPYRKLHSMKRGLKVKAFFDTEGGWATEAQWKEDWKLKLFHELLSSFCILSMKRGLKGFDVKDDWRDVYITAQWKEDWKIKSLFSSRLIAVSATQWKEDWKRNIRRNIILRRRELNEKRIERRKSQSIVWYCIVSAQWKEDWKLNLSSNGKLCKSCLNEKRIESGEALKELRNAVSVDSMKRGLKVIYHK